MELNRPQPGVTRRTPELDPSEQTKVPQRHEGAENPLSPRAQSQPDPQERTSLPMGTSGRTPPLPEPGTLLGKYRLQQPIGSGSSCIVYKAQHVKLPVIVAVKIPRLAESDNTSALREQLRTEAALLAHLNHPNILRLWDYDDDPYPYLVMEHVQGYTLGQVMRKHERLPANWLLQLIYHLTKGLTAALKLDIIHRDLKPENIMVTDCGAVKVADLGLGAVLGNRLLQGVTAQSSGGYVTGTAAYVAPEQARNADEADHRADIYSLGATLYHALSGQLPFQGKSCMEVILKHINEPLRPLSQTVPGIKKEISDLVQRMMAKHPRDRHQTYDELACHIRHALNA